MLPISFYNRDACTVAKALLGKVICKKYRRVWLKARITETEAYYIDDKASHASLGYTEKRKALFMKPGTIYMYYARGGDSLNVSCQGEGNAVLIKSAVALGSEKALAVMQQMNPIIHPKTRAERPRPLDKLCAGQTLLCKSLGIKVNAWDQQQFDPSQFYIEDVGYQPESIIQATRRGIPMGRDEHLEYRFIGL